MLLLARPRPWGVAQLMERRSYEGPAALGEAAAPRPTSARHAVHAQSMRPCLAAALAWPLPSAYDPLGCQARLPGRGTPTSIRL